jgi:hypothetical protein
LSSQELNRAIIVSILKLGYGWLWSKAANCKKPTPFIQFNTGDWVSLVCYNWIYCPLRGMGEKPSPSGEDFSRLAVPCKTTARPHIPFTIWSTIGFGSPSTASRLSLETCANGYGTLSGIKSTQRSWLRYSPPGSLGITSMASGVSSR